MNIIDRPFLRLGHLDIPRPWLPVIVLNPHTGIHRNTYGLIDTGADECALPGSLAPLLGHNLIAGGHEQTNTGNGPTTVYAHTTCLDIEGFKIENALINFMPNLHIPIIGVKSFLSHFILTINYKTQTFSLIHFI